MQRFFACALAAICMAAGIANYSPAASPETDGRTALSTASQANKFCFLLFYKINDPATQSAAKIISQGMSTRSDRAALAYVNITDPAQQATVKQFDVARAPMPLLMAVAPNGAITCVYPKDFRETDLDAAFVTPTMTKVMKSVQDGKLVLLYAHPAGTTQYPESVLGFTTDPQFAKRTQILSLQLTDEAETRFVKDMKLDAAATTGSIVFLAPPGVMIGKYPANTTKAKMAADLHAAGKCCDDPNCKHNHK